MAPKRGAAVQGGLMLELTSMAEDKNVQQSHTGKVVKVKLTVTKKEAKELGRVTRWEKESRGTSLELTGRD